MNIGVQTILVRSILFIIHTTDSAQLALDFTEFVMEFRIAFMVMMRALHNVEVTTAFAHVDDIFINFCFFSANFIMHVNFVKKTVFIFTHFCGIIVFFSANK